MTPLDPRLNAIRPDLADECLRASVEAERYAAPVLRQVVEPLVPVHKAPRFDAMQLTQALMGEQVKVFDEREGWAWVQLVRDGYVGYVNSNALSANLVAPTHRVAVPLSFLYPQASLKSQPHLAVPLNAGVRVEAEEGAYSKLSDGRYAFTSHLAPLGSAAPDYVALAEMFEGVPYLWGGKSFGGLDCSGLVQLCLEAAGIASLRDSDMQEETLGAKLPSLDLDQLRRGDFVFWDGHVGIMTGADTLLHANGHHMAVANEPLRSAVQRIASRYGRMTSLRRL